MAKSGSAAPLPPMPPGPVEVSSAAMPSASSMVSLIIWEPRSVDAGVLSAGASVREARPRAWHTSPPRATDQRSGPAYAPAVALPVPDDDEEAAGSYPGASAPDRSRRVDSSGLRLMVHEWGE